MTANTKIQWAHHTFNPWVGCTKVSPGCNHCYAEGWAKRAGAPQLWAGERRRTRPTNWAQPLKWDKAAATAGERHRVFCASLADVFDNAVDPSWRADLLCLIRDTPNLDWLLLTKRIGNAERLLDQAYFIASHRMRGWNEISDQFPNIWLGATVCNQVEADRDIPKLLSTSAAVRFLSCEPLLAEVDITSWLWGVDEPCARCPRDMDCECGWNTRKQNGLPSLDLVIVGGESGPRPMDPAWAEMLLAQCRNAGTAFFMKQLGGVRNKRGDLDDMPENLRVREFPR